MKNSRLRRAILSGVLCFIVSAAFPLAAQAKDEAPQATPLKAAVSEHFPHGLERKILQALADRMGLEISFSTYPFARRLASLESGIVDLTTGVLKTAERMKDIHFIEAHKRQTYRAFFILKGGPVKIEKYEDLYGLRVGTRIKSLYFDRFDKDDKIDKFPVSDIETHINMLLNGRIDTFAFQEKSALKKLKQLGDDDKIVAAPYKYGRTTSTYISISKKSPLMRDLKEVTRVVTEMTADGSFEKITQDHYRQLGE